MNSIEEIIKEYAPSTDIFQTDTEITRKIKVIIQERLTEPERRIILMYADTASCEKVGKALGVSTTTAWLYIKKIKNKILQWLKQ